jgi:hypothetical protein
MSPLERSIVNSFCEKRSRQVMDDGMYGADHQTRRLLEKHGHGYVLAAPPFSGSG